MCCIHLHILEAGTFPSIHVNCSSHNHIQVSATQKCCQWDQGQPGMVGRSESSWLVSSLDLGSLQSSTSQSASPNLKQQAQFEMGHLSTLLLMLVVIPLYIHRHRVVEGISMGQTGCLLFVAWQYPHFLSLICSLNPGAGNQEVYLSKQSVNKCDSSLLLMIDSHHQQ